jgi:Ran-binding protein 3
VSPKNKRTREAYLEGQAKHDRLEALGEGEPSNDVSVSTKTMAIQEERNPKRPRDKNEDGSGGSGGSRSSTEPQTSAEKFKASGFSSFATAASPLSALNKSGSASPFAAAATGTKSPLSSFASPKEASSSGSGFGALSSGKSVFGGSAGSSAPAAPKSAFGGGFGSTFNTGFGSLSSGKGGLSSFATPGASGITGLSGTQSKPFGAGAEDQEGDDEEEEEDTAKSPGDDAEKEHQASDHDKRFHEQEIETGEEDEDSLWTGRAKLYNWETEGKSWKERGIGTLKLNATKGSPRKARFVLRADGTHRLILNNAVQKGYNYGDANGERPTSGHLYFTGPKENSSELQTQLLKMKAQGAEELFELIKQLKAEMKENGGDE